MTLSFQNKEFQKVCTVKLTAAMRKFASSGYSALTYDGFTNGCLLEEFPELEKLCSDLGIYTSNEVALFHGRCNVKAHTDKLGTDGQLLICVSGNKSQFFYGTSDSRTQVFMRPGDVYFFDSAIEHGIKTSRGGNWSCIVLDLFF